MRVFSCFVLAAGLVIPTAQAKPSKAPASTSFAVLYPFAGAQGDQAKGPMERLGTQVASQGGWSLATGTLFTRSTALARALQGGASQPDALLLPLSSYLALRANNPAWASSWKASHEVSLLSPQQGQFFLVTDDPKRSSCDGASVATHHLDDSPFVTQVVGGKGKALAKVSWVKQRRPIQVLKTLLRGQAECALVDQAQLSAAKQLPGGNAIKVLWTSKKLPSMVVVLQKQTRGWGKVLRSLCRGASAPVCQEVGLQGFSKLSASRIKSIEALYAAAPSSKSSKTDSAAP